MNPRQRLSRPGIVCLPFYHLLPGEPGCVRIGIGFWGPTVVSKVSCGSDQGTGKDG